MLKSSQTLWCIFFTICYIDYTEYVTYLNANEETTYSTDVYFHDKRTRKYSPSAETRSSTMGV